LDKYVGQVGADDSDPGIGLTGIGIEAEAEERDGTDGADDVAVFERAAVARRCMGEV